MLPNDREKEKSQEKGVLPPSDLERAPVNDPSPNSDLSAAKFGERRILRKTVQAFLAKHSYFDMGARRRFNRPSPSLPSDLRPEIDLVKISLDCLGFVLAKKEAGFIVSTQAEQLKRSFTCLASGASLVKVAKEVLKDDLVPIEHRPLLEEFRNHITQELEERERYRGLSLEERGKILSPPSRSSSEDQHAARVDARGLATIFGALDCTVHKIVSDLEEGSMGTTTQDGSLHRRCQGLVGLIQRGDQWLSCNRDAGEYFSRPVDPFAIQRHFLGRSATRLTSL